MQPDTVVKNAFVYNTFTQTFENKHVYIAEGKFYHISLDELECENVIDATGKYMIPGLIDIHMHIESSMTIPTEFSKAVLRHGTTTVVADPHEICNVKGIEGIESYMSQDTVLDIFYGIPSSVPSTNRDLETTGGCILPQNVSRLVNNPKVLCLGEVMNFNDLTKDGDSLTRNIISVCQHYDRAMLIEGHCPKISGLDLSKYLYYGVDADHTMQSPESIYEKITNGMFMEIQRKSLSKENVDVLVSHRFYEYFALVTDDVSADHLALGHLNENVRLAHQLGMPMEQAIYCATYTPARRMHLIDRGTIAPGKLADFILLDNVEEFVISAVYKKGVSVTQLHETSASFPESFYHTICCPMAEEEDFDIVCDTDRPYVVCNVIEIDPHAYFTKRVRMEVPVADGKLQWEKTDLALLTVFERYTGKKSVAYALVKNTLKRGAVGSSWTHDHHNVMVMGRNKKDMKLVQNAIVENQGGYAVADGEIKAFASLQVGGIVSDKPLEQLAESLCNVRNELTAVGYDHDNSVMSFATLSLPVSPEIKVTDKGIVDTYSQKIIPLWEK